MNYKYLIIICLCLPLYSFLHIWESRYHPKGIVELRTYKREYQKGGRANGQAGDYNLLYIQEYRADKPFKFTQYDFGDTVKQTIYKYEGDLTKGLLTSKLDIVRKKVKKDFIKDTTWTVYHYKAFEWKADFSSTIHNKDTLYISAYNYDNAGYLRTEIRSKTNNEILSKTDYSYNAYGNCTAIKHYNYETEKFLLVDEYRIDYDLSRKKRVIGAQMYYRNFGEDWYLLEEYEMSKKGKYIIATEFTDKSDDSNFLEYKFEQDFH